MEKLRIVVGGFIGLYPTGGVTWDYIQYPLGLKLLGHEVYYIEDTGQYSTYRITERDWDDPHDSVAYLQTIMEKFGMAGQWAYRDTFSGQCYGMSLQKVMDICATADLFINISAATIFREEYLRIPRKALIDSDPMFTQVQTFEVKTNIDERYITHKIKVTDYDYHFTFGENIGAPDCLIPSLDIDWIPTRQPICMDHWKVGQNKANGHPFSFTTIMNWSTRSRLEYNNQQWGQKDVEFRKFLAMPQLFANAAFKVVLAVSTDFKKELNREMIAGHGWQILHPDQTIANSEEYQNFIMNSDAEFSIAKETYVKSRSGWFSCRSACYLAAGRPVITQETGWSGYITPGEGLFAFHDEQTALEALEEVTSRYHHHAKAARELAYEYFDSKKVLASMIGKMETAAAAIK
jgi:hypothetical protein